MTEGKTIFLGIEYPNGKLNIEGPFSKYSAEKRLGYFAENAHLPVNLTHAANLAEATRILMHSVYLRERNNLGKSKKVL